MKRIGIMGGTFDPVHNGHLLLGRQARSEYGLDEIWYMPSHIPPHKKDHRITDGKDRLAMLELALEGIPFFSVSDFEMKREGNTYTAQTLELLKEEYPEDKFYFIIGADSLFQLETWYHPEKVMELTSLLVSGREYDPGRTDPGSADQLFKIRVRSPYPGAPQSRNERGFCQDPGHGGQGRRYRRAGSRSRGRLHQRTQAVPGEQITRNQ